MFDWLATNEYPTQPCLFCRLFLPRERLAPAAATRNRNRSCLHLEQGNWRSYVIGDVTLRAAQFRPLPIVLGVTRWPGRLSSRVLSRKGLRSQGSGPTNGGPGIFPVAEPQIPLHHRVLHWGKGERGRKEGRAFGGTSASAGLPRLLRPRWLGRGKKGGRNGRVGRSLPTCYCSREMLLRLGSIIASTFSWNWLLGFANRWLGLCTAVVDTMFWFSEFKQNRLFRLKYGAFGWLYYMHVDEELGD